jgi:hypothetical protein
LNDKFLPSRRTPKAFEAGTEGGVRLTTPHKSSTPFSRL